MYADELSAFILIQNQNKIILYCILWFYLFLYYLQNFIPALISKPFYLDLLIIYKRWIRNAPIDRVEP